MLLFYLFSILHLCSTNNIINLDIITDLHSNPDKIPHEIIKIKNSVKDSDFVVYNGDILNDVNCPEKSVCNIYSLVDNIVNIINKTYIFTLGNHDGEGTVRNKLLSTLYNNHLHIGICNSRLKACRHPELNIFTLDSNTYTCDNHNSYGCPLTEDVTWINDNINNYNHSFLILFTHIPPPHVLGLKAYGIINERPGCWESDKNHLPYSKPKFHIFGHDHNNLFKTVSSSNTTFINALKTGDKRSYGPDFGESGITRISVFNFEPYLNRSLSLNNIDYSQYNALNRIHYNYCSRSGMSRFIKILEIILIIISVVLVIGICIFLLKKNKNYKFYKKISN